jgi:hypothetical protein
MMKRRILSLLGGLIITIAASAQQPPGDSIGVYACLDEGIQKMSIIRYHDVVADNVLPSTFTIGLAEMKARYQFLGATSPNHFRRQAHLRMYFRQLEEEGWVEGILFDPQYSVTDFHIARFDVKDGTRLLTGMTATIIKAKKGARFEKDMVVSYRKIREGVYDVFIDGKPGEYCLVFTGIKGNWAGFVYDFTIL